MSRLDYRALALLVLGLAQMVGALLGIGPLKGLAAATVASPAPKVFSAAKGLETYSTEFFLEWRSVDGEEHVMALTPQVYPKLQGPYNRRNIYGAILAFGPVLYTEAPARPMFDAASEFALCGEAPVLRELGIDPATVDGGVSVRYVPRDGLDLGELPTLIEVPCS
ncbi:hypothetical protein FIV42_16620 [Persicimonas caeni]|jgi:hypothetical protein|uniref:Uncharacterized protein n=1 Tax=Persicimonas caeni TaxID=2292766 RepID=A0A4Y6PVE7_PERCE|nr:hypothetical protein [Persicimonas caeni]QDG52302.1 hypothetical protein FIV42_16620 [Persicimonas caeni]QED33524.1 hypothetical protein FRD00_16615 [Persicimonas caeni]